MPIAPHALHVVTPGRIACVRIPRFAIGAVWRARRPGTITQLTLDLRLPGEPGARPLAPAPGRTFPATTTVGPTAPTTAPTTAPMAAPTAMPVPPSAPVLRLETGRGLAIVRNTADVTTGATLPPATAPGPSATPGPLASPATSPTEPGPAPAPTATVTATATAPTPPPADPHWDDRLLALADGTRLRAVSAAAGHARLRAGMTVTEARGRCGRLVVLPWDPVAIGAAVTRVTGALVRAAPQVTPAGGAPGTWWVGAGGFDGLGGDEALARRLLAIARRWHPQARVAIADSGVAARAATWTNHDSDAAVTHDDGAITIVRPGGDAAFLAPLPLAFLPIDDEFAAALVGLGLRTVGALATLPGSEVEQRWGGVGHAAWHLAQGHDPRRPILARLDEHRSVTAELGGRADSMEPVLFLLRAALDRLVREAARDGRAVAALALSLHLDTVPATLATREVRPAAPLARFTPLFERCRAALEGWALDAPVTGLTVTLTETPPATGDQGDLLDDGWRDPGAALAALERLRAALGQGTVVRPALRDDHRPDAGGAWTDLVDGDAAEEAGSAPPPTCALRLLPAPAPLRIACDADARPVAAAWDGRALTIDHAAGPERLGGTWWRRPWARDYWRLRTRERGTLLVFRDAPPAPAPRRDTTTAAATATVAGTTATPAPARPRDDDGAWFVQGWYD
jgi:protein ImuB